LIIKLKYFFSLLFITSALLNCHQIEKKENKFKLGADVFINNHINLLSNKKIGLVVNHTSLLSNGTHILDTLIYFGVNIAAIFTPEHGFYGSFERGKTITDSEINKIPLFSLHGKVKKPTKAMLANVDLLIYDIQDLGVRFYTYVSTLFYVLESAVENKIPMIVLDRPNPNDGSMVSGPILNNNFKSFLGLTEIPVLYGMTAGELAQLYINEFLNTSNSVYELTVIKMKEWKRDMGREEIGIEWIPPSPNIPDVQTAIVYPGTCFLEGTNISEGRGTEQPFLQIGAPFVSSNDLMIEMNKFIDGTYELFPISFTPISIKGKAENPKYENQVCNGILINVKETQKFKAVGFGVKLIYALHKLYSEKIIFKIDHFDKLAGTNQLRKLILENRTPDYIASSWEKDLNKFNSKREKYLLY
jgi:uncharacterized protein YbbC (DUF1343 family)